MPTKSIGFKTFAPPQKLYNEVQDISRRRLLQILARLDVITVGKVDKVLRNVTPNGREYLERVYERAIEAGLTPLAIPYVVVGILILFGFSKRISRSRLKKIISKSPLLKPIEEAIYGLPKNAIKKGTDA